jgi:outer membrane protein OmpA-like peptidoglycan-associated protein
MSCFLNLSEEMSVVHRFLSVLLAFVFCACPFSSAQSAALRPSDPKMEIFGGYSGYRAGGKVNNVTVPDFTNGWAGQFIINTTHWSAVVIDVNGHYNSFASAHDFAVGLRVQRPVWRFAPFAEGLIGVQHFTPKGLPSQNTPTYIGGGGLDVRLTSRFSIRPFQISYVYTLYDAGTVATDGKRDDLNGFRVQSGLIYNLGLPAQEGPVKAVCSAEPAEVDAGAPVKVSVTAQGFLPKRQMRYSYGTTGGSVAGNLAAATVDTTGVQAGAYTVSAKVVDNGKGKHRQSASCETNFSVKAKLPPTLSVSANPASVRVGDASTVTASGASPDNRPLSYTCSADGGQFTGSGSTYTLDTAGAHEGDINVKCTASDDRGLSASAATRVTVIVQKSKAPDATKFGTIQFMHDKKRPTRVDNEAKGELDRFADALAATPDAKAVLVGYAAAEEAADSKSANFAAERAVNTKDYLKKEKGVDPIRLEPRTATGAGQKVELWLVPAGSSFAAEGTTVVDESKVTAVPRVPLKPKAHRKARHRTPKGN